MQNLYSCTNLAWEFIVSDILYFLIYILFLFLFLFVYMVSLNFSLCSTLQIRLSHMQLNYDAQDETHFIWTDCLKPATKLHSSEDWGGTQHVQCTMIIFSAWSLTSLSLKFGILPDLKSKPVLLFQTIFQLLHSNTCQACAWGKCSDICGCEANS